MLFRSTLFAPLAVILGALLAACNGGSSSPPVLPAGYCGTAPQANSQVVIVPPSASIDTECAEFNAHAILVAFNATDAALQSDIGIGTAGSAFAAVSRNQGSPVPAAGPSVAPTAASSSVPSTPPVTEPVIAYHLTQSGETSMFHDLSGVASTANAALTDWIKREEEPTATRAHPLAEPAIGSWIPMIDDTISLRDENSNMAMTHNTYYKLYERNFTYDYYMIASSSYGGPAFQTCNIQPFGSGAVGWYMYVRLAQMNELYQLREPSLRVYDHGPTNVAGSTSASFTIGGSLNSGGQGSVDASYSQSWSQPNVNTVDVTGKFGGPSFASWDQYFTGWSFSFPFQQSCPPATSTGTFASPWAAIYQVAEVKSPTLQAAVNFIFEYDHTEGNGIVVYKTPTSSSLYAGDGWVVALPLLQICTNIALGLCAQPYEYSVPLNGSLTLEISIRNHSNSPFPPQNATPSLFEPAWRITNVPNWLNVSRLSGVGFGTITLTPQPGTQAGAIATLNVDTDPPGGTPELERGPLVVTVRATAVQ